MRVEIIKCLKDNYSYLLIDETSNEACLIDPSEANPIINFCEKNHIKPKYILNTHHHYDHVGGNQDIKNQYGSKILGYVEDKDRIPGIDLLLDDQEVWKQKNFQAKILHIPGHTTGHICYYFFNEKIVFTGDTLFSLGCGKIFEGTYDQMYESLNKFKDFPLETKIYCGHEYTLQNSKFCIKHDPLNKKLANKILQIEKNIYDGNPTVPSTIKDELECNIFLRANDIAGFSKLRDLKDNF
jgi:hydroxyacylglutathione hydrolase